MKLKRRAPASIYRRWHRSLALFGAAFIIFLVATGMMINHADSLALNQRGIDQPGLLAWYGLRAPANMKSIEVAGRVLTWAGDRLYLDQVEVATTDGSALGAVATVDLIIVAGRQELLLLTRSGDLVERFDIVETGSDLIDGLGQTESGLVVIRSGLKAWHGDQDLLVWKPLDLDSEVVNWSSVGDTGKELRKRISAQYQGPGLNLERLLLDLHSGRFFGPLGVYVYDLLALILLALAVSGLILWQRGRGNGRINGK